MRFSDLTPSSRALLLSKAGPFVARVFNVMPPRDDVTVPSALLRVVLLCRLRHLLLPLVTTAQPAPRPGTTNPGPAP